MRIFRVQTPDGVGPYVGSAVRWEDEAWDRFGSQVGDMHPIPDFDGLEGGIMRCESSAFESLAQYQNWFQHQFLDVIEDVFYEENMPMDYRLYEYEVAPQVVRTGKSQIAVLTAAMEKPVAVHDLRAAHYMV